MEINGFLPLVFSKNIRSDGLRTIQRMKTTQGKNNDS